MKKIISFISLLALLVSGCTREEILQNVTPVSREGRTFTTSFENNESRTYLEDGRFSRWTEGDRISLFDASTLNSQYLFAGDTGDSGGTFFRLSKPEGSGSSLPANYAVYPYDKDMTISADGVITLNLPSNQHYAENSYGLGDNTMVAVTKDTIDTFLQFKNVGGCFKLQFYGDDVTVKSITLMGNNGEKIAGKATITAAYGGAPIVTMTNDATTSITLDCDEKGVKIGASAEEATTFWVVVPPTTFNKGITITIKDMDGKVFTQTTDKLLAVQRNVVKPMAAVKVVAKPDVTNDWSFSYEENYVDSLNAIYCEQAGVIALFGYKDIPMKFNPVDEKFVESKERIICISSIDQNRQTLDESNATIIVCDSTYFPIHIANKDMNIILTKNDDSHFNCIVYNSPKDEYIEFNNIEYNLENINTAVSTRTVVTGGYSEFNLHNALKAINILISIKNGFQKACDDDALGVLAENLQILSSLSNNDELGLGVGVTLTPGWFKLLPIAEYLTGKFDKFIIKEMGKVHFSIDSPKIINVNSCEVFYEISGLNQNGIENSEVGMVIYNNHGYFDWEIFESGNYKSSHIWRNLPVGKFTIEFYVKSKKYQWLEFRAMMTVYMFDVGLDHYEIKPDEDYKCGKVSFGMNVFLKGNADELNEWMKQNGQDLQIGYYVKHPNEIDYKQVKNFSTIFVTTELSYDLTIPREVFSDENINYINFKAEPSFDYSIGTYVVMQGEPIHLDEQFIEGLVYDEEPIAITGETISTTSNSAIVEATCKNFAFWGGVCGIEYYSTSDKKQHVIAVYDECNENKSIEVPLTELESGTTYYYRAYIEIDGKKIYGEERSFKTDEEEFSIEIISADISLVCPSGNFDGNTSLRHEGFVKVKLKGDYSHVYKVCIVVYGESDHVPFYSERFSTSLTELEEGFYFNWVGLELFKYDYDKYTVSSVLKELRIEVNGSRGGIASKELEPIVYQSGPPSFAPGEVRYILDSERGEWTYGINVKNGFWLGTKDKSHIDGEFNIKTNYNGLDEVTVYAPHYGNYGNYGNFNQEYIKVGFWYTDEILGHYYNYNTEFIITYKYPNGMSLTFPTLRFSGSADTGLKMTGIKTEDPFFGL